MFMWGNCHPSIQPSMLYAFMRSLEGPAAVGAVANFLAKSGNLCGPGTRGGPRSPPCMCMCAGAPILYV